MRLSGLERARLERDTHRDSLAQAAMGKHILNTPSKFMSIKPSAVEPGWSPAAQNYVKTLAFPPQSAAKGLGKFWISLEQGGSHTQGGFTAHSTALQDSITEEFTLKIPDEGNPGVGGMATAMFCREFMGTERGCFAPHPTRTHPWELHIPGPPVPCAGRKGVSASLFTLIYL